jgi:alpha-beta hydrolase superfamily lysophospholipase
MTAVTTTAPFDRHGPASPMKIHTVISGGGLRLHAREWGNPDGPPILFIHGWSQSHLCWAKQYESSLADEFRLVAYDLRGHGMSEMPLEPKHYTDGRLWADDVAAIIEQLRLDRPVLVGWSYGPFVIVDYIRAYDRNRSPRSTSSREPSSSVRLPSVPSSAPASSTTSRRQPKTTCRPTSARCARSWPPAP